MTFLLTLLLLAFADCKPSSSVLEKAAKSEECGFNSTSHKDRDFCPPGLFCVDGDCECGVYPGYIMRCNGTNAMLMTSYCATFDESTNTTSIGACLQMAKRTGHQIEVYFALPRVVDELSDEICSVYNRTGTLCGKCLPDHYPLAYSYDTSCILCPDARWNWLRYIMGAYIPLTVFFFIIIFFKINTTSSHLFAVVFYCQTIVMPVALRTIGLEIQSDTNSAYYTAARVFFSLYGIWNLDFFRPFYSDLCLGIGILPTLALDYAIAVYPLILLVMAYLVIYLHDKDFRAVRIVFCPFKYLSTILKRNWDIRTSMVDAFATFFLLSNIKFLSVSFDFLIPTQIYELHRDHFTLRYGLYYAAEVPYFGKEHLPYGILAVLVLTIFVFLPITVLALYPFMVFQKFLNLFPFHWHALHTFVDAFCGCYQDGTEPGTRDYRWFVSLFFVLRVLQFLLYFLPVKIMYNDLITMALVLYTTLFAVLQPFKSSVSYLNSIHILFLQALNIFCLMTLGVTLSSITAPNMAALLYTIAVIISLVPFYYFLAKMVYWIYTHRETGQRIIQSVRAWRGGYQRLNHENDQLPDRIVNSNEYHKENLANFSS